MYKFNKNSLPRIFDDFFKKTSQIHSHKTRLTFHVPFTANCRTQRTIRYQGPTLGNYIFSKLNVSSHSWALLTFKTKLKKFLLKNEIEFLWRIIYVYNHTQEKRIPIKCFIIPKWQDCYHTFFYHYDPHLFVRQAFYIHIVRIFFLISSGSSLSFFPPHL